ncbi:MAG: hypothetical protein WAW39_30525 [Prosthecobacter sp.]|uniref:hypothetical protein n=1 Tax=Prosthecobacter sp. TaxID=1965333 RepID=UPI003BAF0A59
MRQIAIDVVTEIGFDHDAQCQLGKRGDDLRMLAQPELMKLAHAVFRLLGGGQRVVAKEARPPALVRAVSQLVEK